MLHPSPNRFEHAGGGRSARRGGRRGPTRPGHRTESAVRAVDRGDWRTARFVRTLRGLNRQFGCLDNGQLEELATEHRLASNPGLQTVECWYWIRKLQARFFAGDHVAAID